MERSGALPRFDLAAGGATRRWRTAAAALAVALAGLLALFWDTAAGAVAVWVASATYNHCFLILPVSLYLIHQRRASLAAPRPSVVGLLVLAAAAALWLAGELASINEVRQFALVGMIQGVVLTVLGSAVYRQLLFPLLYLFFLVPTGEFLVGPLQDFTAAFVVGGLELVGVPVYGDGIFIQIPNGSFHVAEACAGLRFLIASVAFGALFAYVVYRDWGRRAAFVAASMIVPVLANGLRAFGIVLIAHLSDNRLAVGVDHLVYGWGFFTAVMLLLIWIGLKFQQRPTADEGRGGEGAAAGRPAFLAAAAAVLLVVSLPQAYAAHLRNTIPQTNLAALAPPLPAPQWTLLGEDDSWRPLLPGVDREVSATYGRDGERVVAYVGFYTHQGPGKKIAGSENRMADGQRWRRVAGDAGEISLDGRRLSVRGERLTDGSTRRLLWYWYWVDGRFTASVMTAKLLQLRAELLGRGRAAAVVALAGDYRDAPDEAAARLAAFAAAMPPLAPQLAAVAAAPKE